MDCSSPGSSVRETLQARIVERAASSRESSEPRGWTRVSYVSCAGRCVLYHVPPGKPWEPTFLVAPNRSNIVTNSAKTLKMVRIKTPQKQKYPSSCLMSETSQPFSFSSHFLWPVHSLPFLSFFSFALSSDWSSWAPALASSLLTLYLCVVSLIGQFIRGFKVQGFIGY